MAEIVDQLRLEIDQALRDIGRVEQALDTALAPVEIQIDVDQAQLQQMEDTLREVQRIADRAATETQSIALAAGRAEVNFEDLARAMGITEAEARDLTTELLQSQAASNRLEDSARDIARQLGLSENEANRLTTSLRQADRAAEAIDVTAVSVASRFTSLRTAAAGIASAFAVIGGAQIFGQVLRGANAAVQQFAEVQDSINAVNVVFKEGAGIALEFGETAAQSAGLSQLAFNQAVAPIGALLTNFGSTAREAAEGAVILVQRGADLASVYGGSVQDALLAINSALVGQVEPLRKFGAEISQARVQAFALATGMLEAGEEMDTATAVQARLGLILKDTAVVAGDFANTSDDLANAQRIAAAEAQNFGSEVGEVLAPALEVLVGLLPEVLDGVRQLVPEFAAGADSAAAFFESMGEGGGFRTEFAGIAAGFDVFTTGAGLVSEAAQAIGGLGLDIIKLDGDFTNATGALVRGGALIERAFTRGIAVSLANALDKGTDSVDAFTDSISQVARQTSVIGTFTSSYRDFAIAANLSDVELRDATQGLLNNAEALELTADEIAFLIPIVNELNETLDTGGRANRDYLANMAGFGATFDTVTTRFTTFAGDLETGSDRAANALAELSAAAERQQARTAAAFNLFEDLPEQISGSFTAAVEALRTQVESIADFDINIAILRALDLNALADEFLAQGIAAAGPLEQAINNIPLAIEADELLQGFGAIGEEAFDALVERFISVGIEPADARRLAEELSSPEVINAATEAGKSIGAAQAGTYHDTLSSELDQLIPETGRDIGDLIDTHWRLEDEANSAAEGTASSFLDGIKASITPQSVLTALDLFGIELDLTDTGIGAGVTLINGMVIGVSSPSAVDRLRDSIVDATNNALEIRSPSRVMLDIGESAGEAFWSGFNQAELNLRVAAPAITGGIAPGTTAAGVAGAVNVNINLDHASLQDPVSDVARMGQIAGSVAQTFNSVRPQ